MERTPVSLLKKLKQRDHPVAEMSWKQFVKLFTPLLYHWANRLEGLLD